MKPQRIKFGYALTLSAGLVLLGSYAFALWDGGGRGTQLLAGAALTLLPLLLFLPGVVARQARAFSALALLAPLYLFYAGLIWLWKSPQWGLWLSLWAVVLELGAILHNFRRRARTTSHP